MKSLQKLFVKAASLVDRLVDLLAIFAGILLAFAAIIVGFGISSRYFMGKPIFWVNEICEYIILYITFLVAAWVLRQEGHVKMDIVLNQLSLKTQHIVNIITSTLCAVGSLVLTWFGIKVTWKLYASKAFTYTVLEVPKYIIASVIFVGSLLLFFQFIKRICSYLQALSMIQKE
jgi:C4-dicarboxylate transporter, DctQ subunit